MKATNEQILAAYAETKSVWASAKRLGMCGQSVHERLVKLGVSLSMRPFSETEYKRLKDEYQQAAAEGSLATLAAKMGRTKQFICRKAREIGLTDQRRERRYNAVWKYVNEEEARSYFEQLKRAKGTIGQFCQKRGYDDLGFTRCMRRHFPDEWDHVVELKQIKQTPYRYGRQFEYRVRDELRELGYFALRSPASKGVIDIIAIKLGVVLFIQCKRNGALEPSGWNKLFDLAKSTGSVPILASTPTGFGVDYRRLLERKDRSKHRQPFEVFRP